MLEAAELTIESESPWLPRVVTFLNAIGIATQCAPVPTDCFLPGVEICAGGLKYDANQMLAVSDLLHEAGHIAVTPKAHRALLGGQLEPAEQLPHGGEVEAIAWSFAAAQHLGMPLEELFHPDGYRGNASSLAFNFSVGVYPGVHGLVCAGLAKPGPLGGAESYPKLLQWLRD